MKQFAARAFEGKKQYTVVETKGTSQSEPASFGISISCHQMPQDGIRLYRSERQNLIFNVSPLLA